MKKIILIILFIAGISFSQGVTIKTKTNYCFFMYQDTIKNEKGNCVFDVKISIDTVYIQSLPPLTISIQKRDPSFEQYNGTICQMYGTDETGVKCIVKLFITQNQKELHVIYKDAEYAFILDEY